MIPGLSLFHVQIRHRCEEMPVTTILEFHVRVTDKNGILVRPHLYIWFTGSEDPDPSAVHPTDSSHHLQEAHRAHLILVLMDGSSTAPEKFPIMFRWGQET